MVLTVVIDGLIGLQLTKHKPGFIEEADVNTYNEGITLTGEYLNSISYDRLVVDAIRLNDGECMAVDLEKIVGVARNIDEAETVSVETNKTCTFAHLQQHYLFPCSTLMTARSLVVGPPL